MANYGLSAREEEVVGVVVRGYSTRQTSRSLFISEHTVQRHLCNTFEKVGVRGRRALVMHLFFDSLLPGTPGQSPPAGTGVYGDSARMISTPLSRATTAALVRPVNRPHSRAPGMLRISVSSAAGSGIEGNRQSAV